MDAVYVETSIPSMYFDTRQSQAVRTRREVTREWWRTHAARYRLVTSAFVLNELREAPEPKRAAAEELLGGVRVLPVPLRITEVVSQYLRHRVMPRGALGDAAHAAMCALHGVPFLVTWNCKHLANGNKLMQLRTINDRLGLPTPMMVTPPQLGPVTGDSP